MSKGQGLGFCQLAAFLEDQPSGIAEIVIELRKVVLESAPNATETMVWGGLSYHDPAVGGRVKGAVCRIAIHRDHVHLSFMHGVGLPDPSGILRGDRRSRRFVPIRTLGDAGALPLSPLIQAAAKRAADR